MRINKKQQSEFDRYNNNYKEEFECWGCGKKIVFEKVEPMERVYCKSCRQEKNDSHKNMIKQYTSLKVEVMHENALRELEKSYKCYLNDMRDSIEFVRELELESPESFMSMHEIIAAIILVDNGIDFIIDKKVLNYKVDFFIPQKHICLEIDGKLHNMKLAKDGKRDVEIRNELGSEWETIRIPTDFITINPNMLVDAIDTAYAEIKKVRKLNNGIIPSSFSRTTKAYYNEYFGQE